MHEWACTIFLYCEIPHNAGGKKISLILCVCVCVRALKCVFLFLLILPEQWEMLQCSWQHLLRNGMLQFNGFPHSWWHHLFPVYIPPGGLARWEKLLQKQLQCVCSWLVGFICCNSSYAGGNLVRDRIANFTSKCNFSISDLYQLFHRVKY